jgi:hypothetical protein
MPFTLSPRKSNQLKSYLTTLCFLSIVFLQAQNLFKPGYILFADGQQIACEIYDKQWKNNPEEITYRINSESDAVTGSLAEIRAFGITNGERYRAVTVSIDVSTHNLNALEEGRHPQMKQFTVFLKELVTGPYSLFEYTDNKMIRYFYSYDSLNIQQLIYKPYLLKEKSEYGNNQVVYNKYFLQQLWMNVNCEKHPNNYFKRIEYLKSDLIKYFREQNECVTGVETPAATKERKDWFNLYVTPGLIASELTIQNSRFEHWGTGSASSVEFRIGMDAEFILPFNNRKWAITIEPNYTRFQATMLASPLLNFEAEMHLLNLPVGVRHVFFLSEHSTLFIGAFYVNSIGMGNSTIYESYFNNTMKVRCNHTLAFSIGANYKRIGLEFRYILPQDMLATYALWPAKKNAIEAMLRIKLF